MTTTEPTPLACGMVAHWAEQRGSAQRSRCAGCGEHLDAYTVECPQCAQPAGHSTAMLAQVIETSGGDRQLVVSARTPGGGWEPVRVVEATADAVRMIRANAAGVNARAEARAVVRHGCIGTAGQGVLA